MSTIRSVQQADWPHFCCSASAEGWRVPQFELEVFQAEWSNCVQVMERGGQFAGLVTAVAHGRSGWIGNLLVSSELRGQGYGVRLFQAALADLTKRGVTTCWLTASERGKLIYDKFGFVEVNRVERWVLRQRVSSDLVVADSADAEGELLTLDSRAWGETRGFLLETVSTRGEAFGCDDAAALLQRGADLQVIGPWYSETCCPRANRQLLQKLLSVADPGVEIVTDILTSSRLNPLLAAAGFEHVGETVLMARGDCQTVAMQMMVSLASLGSFG